MNDENNSKNALKKYLIKQYNHMIKLYIIIDIPFNSTKRYKMAQSSLWYYFVHFITYKYVHQYIYLMPGCYSPKGG